MEQGGGQALQQIFFILVRQQSKNRFKKFTTTAYFYRYAKSKKDYDEWEPRTVQGIALQTYSSKTYIKTQSDKPNEY